MATIVASKECNVYKDINIIALNLYYSSKKDELDFCEGDNVQSKIKYVVVQRANVCFIAKE